MLLNSFIGIGGIFDLASMAGIEKDHNDFGITFGKWGFPDGPYLFIPAIGPLTVRDGTGYLVRRAVGPVGYIPDVPLRNSLYGLGLRRHTRSVVAGREGGRHGSGGQVRFVRNAYLRTRRYLLFDGKPPPEDEDDGGAVDPAACGAACTRAAPRTRMLRKLALILLALPLGSWRLSQRAGSARRAGETRSPRRP